MAQIVTARIRSASSSVRVQRKTLPLVLKYGLIYLGNPFRYPWVSLAKVLKGCIFISLPLAIVRSLSLSLCLYHFLSLYEAKHFVETIKAPKGVFVVGLFFLKQSYLLSCSNCQRVQTG